VDRRRVITTETKEVEKNTKQTKVGMEFYQASNHIHQGVQMNGSNSKEGKGRNWGSSTRNAKTLKIMHAGFNRLCLTTYRLIIIPSKKIPSKSCIILKMPLLSRSFHRFVLFLLLLPPNLLSFVCQFIQKQYIRQPCLTTDPVVLHYNNLQKLHAEKDSLHQNC
jgi:hypothetical protein